MKQLLVLSGKGGTGKTTVAAAFIQLAAARAFADCDVDAPNLHLTVDIPEGAEQQTPYLGLPKAVIDPDACDGCGLCFTHCRFDAIANHPVHRVEALACEGCGLCAVICPQDAITMQPNMAGIVQLHLDADRSFSAAELFMGNGTSGRLVSAVKSQLVGSAPVGTDLAIIDGSPGIGCPVMASMSGVDLILVVAEPTKSGVHDLIRLLDLSQRFGIRAGVCLNRAGIDPDWDLKTEAYCVGRGTPVVGTIPYDPAVVAAINNSTPVVDSGGPAAAALIDAFTASIDLLNQPLTPTGTP